MDSGIITTQEFLLSLIDTGQYVHVTDGKNAYRLKQTKGFTDLYFVAGSASHKGTGKQGRVKDVDIVCKKYFFIDYDIRSCVLQEQGKLLSTHGLFAYLDKIKAELKGLYAKWKYIVYSGNGFHIYYEIENKPYTPLQYREAVKYIYKSAPYQNFIDTSCSSISNLARLPGFKNTKIQKKYGINTEEYCRVLEQNNHGPTFNLDAIYASISKPQIKKVKKTEIKTENEIENIYMPDLVKYYFGFELQANGREFKGEDGNMGMFYDRERNLLIYNGTKHLKGDLQGYNPYTFIKYEVLGSKFSHPRDVFQELKRTGFIN